MILPIIILARDRPLQLSDMVQSIKAVTQENTYRIIICDNASTQPEMLDLLKSLETDCTVFRNDKNMIMEGLNPGLAMVKEPFFVISDPDILMNPMTPRNWIDLMINGLQNTQAPKIGLALNRFYPYSPLMERHIKELEQVHWNVRTDIPGISDECWGAAVDTTFAMYRADTFTHWQNGKNLVLGKKNDMGLYGSGILMQFYSRQYGIPIRIADRWTAEHTGWYVNPKYYPDYEYYKYSCKGGVSTALSRTGFLVELIKNNKVESEIAKYKAMLPKEFGPSHPLWRVPSVRNKHMMVEKLTL